MLRVSAVSQRNGHPVLHFSRTHIYVKPDGDDHRDGLSLATARRTPLENRFVINYLAPGEYRLPLISAPIAFDPALLNAPARLTGD